jgi:thiol:disulfide interchange protein
MLLIIFVAIVGVVGWRLAGCTVVQATCSNTASQSATLAISQELAPDYYTYSPAGVEKALAEGQRVVLYFWAPWCSSCSSVDLDLLARKAQVPLGVKMFRVSYDKEHELRQKYAITVQHSFVQIDQNYHSLQHWVGGEMDEVAERVI